jgi:hypothetical protein
VRLGLLRKINSNGTLSECDWVSYVKVLVMGNTLSVTGSPT